MGTHLALVQPDEPELQPDLAELQPNEPELQPNQPELLAHLAFILSYESELLAHLTLLQPNQPELLTHVSLVQPHPRMTGTQQHIGSTRLLDDLHIGCCWTRSRSAQQRGCLKRCALCYGSGRMTQMHTAPGSHLFPDSLLACEMVGTRQACVCVCVCAVVCVASRANMFKTRK